MLIPGQPVFLEALGWALLNSLWQFGLLWLFFILFVSVCKKDSSTFRHDLALVLLSAGSAGFVTNLLFQYFVYTDHVPESHLLRNDAYAVPYSIIRHFLENSLPYLSAAYLLVVTGLFFKFFRYFFLSHRILKKGLVDLPDWLGPLVQQLAHQLNIQRKVRILVSELVDTPMIMGFLKPTILIPVACINHLPVNQLEAILIHELAHIRRNDYLVNLYLAGCEIVFFFNPFARFLVNTIKQEREHCCDDKVVEINENAHQYASALLALEQSRSGYLNIGLGATGRSKTMLLNRIQRILKVNTIYRVNFSAQFLASLIATFFFCLGAFVIPGDPQAKKLVVSIATQENIKVNSNTVTPGKEPIPELPARDADSNIELQEVVKSSLEPILPVIPPFTEDDPYNLPVAEYALDENEVPLPLTMTVNTVTRDFSIPSKKDPVLPFTVMIPNSFPFVPLSSFSFFKTTDTTKPGNNQMSMQKRIALESARKAKLALDKIDWNKIQSGLKNEIDITALRQEIQLNLEQINREELNRALTDSLQLESIENLKSEMDELLELRKEQLQLYEIERDQHKKKLKIRKVIVYI